MMISSTAEADDQQMIRFEKEPQRPKSNMIVARNSNDQENNSNLCQYAAEDDKRQPEAASTATPLSQHPRLRQQGQQQPPPMSSKQSNSSSFCVIGGHTGVETRLEKRYDQNSQYQNNQQQKITNQHQNNLSSKQENGTLKIQSPEHQDNLIQMSKSPYDNLAIQTMAASQNNNCAFGTVGKVMKQHYLRKHPSKFSNVSGSTGAKKRRPSTTKGHHQHQHQQHAHHQYHHSTPQQQITQHYQWHQEQNEHVQNDQYQNIGGELERFHSFHQQNTATRLRNNAAATRRQHLQTTTASANEHGAIATGCTNNMNKNRNRPFSAVVSRKLPSHQAGFNRLKQQQSQLLSQHGGENSCSSVVGSGANHRKVALRGTSGMPQAAGTGTAQFSNLLLSPTNNHNHENTVLSAALSHPNVKYYIDNSGAKRGTNRIKSAAANPNKNHRTDQIVEALNEFMIVQQQRSSAAIVGESLKLKDHPATATKRQRQQLNQNQQKTLGSSSLAAKDLLSTQASCQQPQQNTNFQHTVLSTNRHGVTHRQELDYYNNRRPLSGGNATLMTTAQTSNYNCNQNNLNNGLQHRIQLNHLNHHTQEDSQNRKNIPTTLDVDQTIEQNRLKALEDYQRNTATSMTSDQQQVRLSAQIFARTKQSGVHSLCGAVATPVTLNSNLMQNELVRKSLQQSQSSASNTLTTTLQQNNQRNQRTTSAGKGGNKTPSPLPTSSADQRMAKSKAGPIISQTASTLLAAAQHQQANTNSTPPPANIQDQQITRESIPQFLLDAAANEETVILIPSDQLHQIRASNDSTHHDKAMVSQSAEFRQDKGLLTPQYQQLVVHDGKIVLIQDHGSFNNFIDNNIRQSINNAVACTIDEEAASTTVARGETAEFNAEQREYSVQIPYGQHNMNPMVTATHTATESKVAHRVLQQTIAEMNSRAPTLAANDQMHNLLQQRQHHEHKRGISFTARRRLDEMEACGLEGKTLRKSVQIQKRMAQKLGLSSADQQYSSKYKRTIFQQSNLLGANHIVQNNMVNATSMNWRKEEYKTEMEKLEDMARIEGFICKKNQLEQKTSDNDQLLTAMLEQFIKGTGTSNTCTNIGGKPELFQSGGNIQNLRQQKHLRHPWMSGRHYGSKSDRRTQKPTTHKHRKLKKSILSITKIDKQQQLNKVAEIQQDQHTVVRINAKTLSTSEGAQKFQFGKIKSSIVTAVPSAYERASPDLAMLEGADSPRGVATNEKLETSAANQGIVDTKTSPVNKIEPSHDDSTAVKIVEQKAGVSLFNNNENEQINLDANTNTIKSVTRRTIIQLSQDFGGSAKNQDQNNNASNSAVLVGVKDKLDKQKTAKQDKSEQESASVKQSPLRETTPIISRNQVTSNSNLNIQSNIHNNDSKLLAVPSQENEVKKSYQNGTQHQRQRPKSHYDIRKQQMQYYSNSVEALDVDEGVEQASLGSIYFKSNNNLADHIKTGIALTSTAPVNKKKSAARATTHLQEVQDFTQTARVLGNSGTETKRATKMLNKTASARTAQWKQPLINPTAYPPPSTSNHATKRNNSNSNSFTQPDRRATPKYHHQHTMSATISSSHRKQQQTTAQDKDVNNDKTTTTEVYNNDHQAAINIALPQKKNKYTTSADNTARATSRQAVASDKNNKLTQSNTPINSNNPGLTTKKVSVTNIHFQGPQRRAAGMAPPDFHAAITDKKAANHNCNNNAEIIKIEDGSKKIKLLQTQSSSNKLLSKQKAAAVQGSSKNKLSLKKSSQLDASCLTLADIIINNEDSKKNFSVTSLTTKNNKVVPTATTQMIIDAPSVETEQQTPDKMMAIRDNSIGRNHHQHNQAIQVKDGRNISTISPTSQQQQISGKKQAVQTSFNTIQRRESTTSLHVDTQQSNEEEEILLNL